MNVFQFSLTTFLQLGYTDKEKYHSTILEMASWTS